MWIWEVLVLKKKDFILIGIIIVVIIGAFGVNGYIKKEEPEQIEIYVDNQLYKTIDINATEDIASSSTPLFRIKSTKRLRNWA